MSPSVPRSLRVEQALRIVPELEALAPLRALLISASRPDGGSLWASSAPYLTVGKRYLAPQEVRRRLPAALRQVIDQLAALYDAVLEALEAESAGDTPRAVAALLGAGEHEERVGRFAQARSWYELALSLSEGLRDRRPQVRALRSLGRLCHDQGRYREGARYYAESLKLAEAELDTAGFVTACQGLGNLALAQGAWVEAQAWYTRGLAVAESAGDELRRAQFAQNLSIVARRRGDLAAAAEHLRQAREVFEGLGNAEEMARVFNSQGLLDLALGLHASALNAYRTALEWVDRSGGNPWLEVSIRINLSELYLETNPFLQAEEELRRAEEIAIAHNFEQRLAQIYAVMGKLRGRQGDENGFVFFENALELCRSTEGSPLVEGQVHYEYGVFRRRLGELAEARAHLERAHEILASLGDLPELRLVETELEILSN